MKIAIKDTILLGGSGAIVRLKRGIQECSATSFENCWNSGDPAVQMTHENEVHGWTDTDALECDLDVALAKFILEKIGSAEWDISQLIVVINLKKRQISMAMPFDNGRRYAIGVLKFEVKKGV